MKRKDNSGGRPRIEEGDKKKAVISFRTDKITRRHLEKLVKQTELYQMCLEKLLRILPLMSLLIQNISMERTI